MACNAGERIGLQHAVRERIRGVSVEARRDEHELGLELARCAKYDVLEQRQPFDLARSGRHGDVDREALALAAARVGERARAGIQRPLVDAREQHVAARAKDLGVQDDQRDVVFGNLHAPCPLVDDSSS